MAAAKKHNIYVETQGHRFKYDWFIINWFTADLILNLNIFRCYLDFQSPIGFDLYSIPRLQYNTMVDQTFYLYKAYKTAFQSNRLFSYWKTQ